VIGGIVLSFLVFLGGDESVNDPEDVRLNQLLSDVEGVPTAHCQQLYEVLDCRLSYVLLATLLRRPISTRLHHLIHHRVLLKGLRNDFNNA
jgi:hypothetical protein